MWLAWEANSGRGYCLIKDFWKRTVPGSLEE